MQRDWLEKDFYATLGVAPTASAKEITKAYRKLAREWHPDANPNDPRAEERFKEVSAAYDVLGDEDRRREYDEVRRMGPSAFGDSFRFDGGGGADLGDLLGRMFGGAAARRGAAGPQRGADVETVLTLDFDDAVRGVTTSLHLTTDAVCSGCSGSGARPGTTPTTCPACYGRGVVEENQGPFAFSTTCRRCGGRGSMVEYPCATCRGTGAEKRDREVKARIPAGVEDGQRIRLKGRGTAGRNGGPSGDLYVVCVVRPHPRFGRDGLHLTTRVPVSVAEAALGSEVLVPTLDGGSVTLRLKPGSQPGARYRVSGRGIVTPRAKGDLIVTLEVVVPRDVNDEQRAALEALEAASEPVRAEVRHGS